MPFNLQDAPLVALSPGLYLQEIAVLFFAECEIAAPVSVS